MTEKCSFWNQLSLVFPECYESVRQTFIDDKRVCFRLNTIKSLSWDEVCLPQGIEYRPVPGCPDTLSVSSDNRALITHSDAAVTGKIYVQNPSSILLARALPLQESDRVLDLAAAPGGKTSILAIAKSELWAVDCSKSRFFRLRDNMERLGVSSVKFLCADGRKLGRKFFQYFDKILLDAPCSGDARFRASTPDSAWVSSSRLCYYKQTALSAAAWQMLRPGGLLLYVTCALSPLENEAVVSHLLKRKDDARVLPLVLSTAVQPGLSSWGKNKVHDDLRFAVRIVPTNEYDGLFACLIKKFS
ncbi:MULTISPECIES: RsmB/NOP family class I SAM-dependent RNA methyltransferase [Candidatus Ichthyocystis]|uniref:Putative rRNA cytosine-C5-methyltransferase n=1 Tax=Candidatus Ichthyocystis hellenicum TaxID=1561003 RepID=A0A0S4M5L0_9BURK|nr:MULTISPECIES: RsmB/NOP family class I SAM-dependent RNA methyltransferase [Ichthyocystis]CUT17533.1 putative rRNA cytosine-C5-methyltransferase [Candidatus Ichthyocystis hellenicum]